MSNITKEVFLKIQEEYQPTSEDYFLCDSSPTFRSLWSKDRHEVRDLAKIFMTIEEYKEKYNNVFFVGYSVLFVHNVALAYEAVEEKVQIRRDFINWLINNIE